MPSPIAHAVTGYCLGRLWPNGEATLRRRTARRISVGVATFASVAPDLDFLPKILWGADTHRGISHSLGLALVASLVLAALFARSTRKQFVVAGAMAFSAYTLHLVMDLLTKGGRGLPVFWPFTHTLLAAPISLFPQVHHSEGFIYPGHIPVLIVESTYAVILIGLTHWIERRQGKHPSAQTPARQQALIEPAGPPASDAQSPELTSRQ